MYFVVKCTDFIYNYKLQPHSTTINHKYSTKNVSGMVFGDDNYDEQGYAHGRPCV